MFGRLAMFSLCLALVGAPADARTVTLRFVPEVPTLLGQRDDTPPYQPGPLRYYDEGPSAGIISLDAPAPPNGCEGVGGGFLVASGRHSARGCYGGP